MRSNIGLLLLTLLATLSACGGKHYSSAPSQAQYNNLEPYLSNGAYSHTLKRCAIAHTGNACNLIDLPLLAMEVDHPSVEDIMERVLVSHDWMGKNFEDVLKRMPDDMLYLFGSVTAIVIDDDIRPAYYTSVTGAIYLDPGYLWLNPSQYDDISKEEDYRSEYIRRLSFRPAWRYTNANRPAGRSLDSITLDMAQLLFHELAHANDVMPRNLFRKMNSYQTINKNARAIETEIPSYRLRRDMPLQSSVMFHLAKIMYAGNPVSDAYATMTAEEVANHFRYDFANDDYAYHSQYEYLAMLFEETMMKMHFNFDRDVAYLHEPTGDSCNDLIVAWGMRNRIAAPGVKERAQWVLQQLFPTRDYTEWFEGLAEPQLLPTYVGWCESESLGVNSMREKSFGLPNNSWHDEPINEQWFLPPGGAHPKL